MRLRAEVLKRQLRREASCISAIALLLCATLMSFLLYRMRTVGRASQLESDAVIAYLVVLFVLMVVLNRRGAHFRREAHDSYAASEKV